MHDEDDLHDALKELIFPSISLFLNMYCNNTKCNASLEDYGADPQIFGKDDFIDLILCGKCASDFYAEEDYHYQKMKDELENIISEPIEKEKAQTYEIQETAHKVFKSLALGMSENDILKKYPYLNRSDLLACYKFAAQRV